MYFSGMTNTEELIAKYRATAAAWDELQGDAKKANPVSVRLHGIYRQLRSSKRLKPAAGYTP
jgi:hypothetical protein